jgi:predicted regulator of Ras-like GTPase activity (Roadblock/LC7/MglB family)
VVNITLQDQVNVLLQNIKTIKGVEHCVLTQRDGNPIQSAGIWLSKNEVFSVSASTSAIYNCGLQMHQDDLKYILIEGNRAKILLSPLKNTENPTIDRIMEAQGYKNQDDEFFIALSTHPEVNLGGVLVRTRQILVDIKKALILSGESFKPPLRNFDQSELEKIYDLFNAKDDLSKSDHLDLFSFSISPETSYNLESLLNEYSKQILDLKETFLTFDGGFIAASLCPDYNRLSRLDTSAIMSYSLFSTADKCAWFLKKMHIDSILLECQNEFQFINRVGNGIFSTSVAKGRQKLGLLRLIVPRYCQKMAKILENKRESVQARLPSLNLNTIFSELSM